MTDPDPPAPLLSWRIHPAATRPQAALLTGLVILTFSIAAAITFEHFGWGLLSAAVLLGSLNQFFLPSVYTIDEQGVSASLPLSTRRLEWRHVRRVEVAPHSVLLSMRLRRSWFAARREVRLPLGRDRDRILDLVRTHVTAEIT
ncbi:MAG: hypothetical protein KJZ69_14600 [Phycisphaerales bacterium]|nr:hypothetical protein [Phycisphaerales bacterium]